MTSKQKALLAEIIQRCPPAKYARLATELVHAASDLALDGDDENEWREFLRDVLEHLAKQDRAWPPRSAS